MFDQQYKRAKASWQRNLWTGVLLLIIFPGMSRAGEGPFFITYTHQMEEPDNLDMSSKGVTGAPSGGSWFFAAAAELEYGIKGWWTTELYLDGQGTEGESTIFYRV